MKRRVVVTGIGIISPLGYGLNENWTAITEGRSGVGLISKFDADPFSVKIAGEVKGFIPEDHINHKDVKKMDTFIHYALVSSQLALQDSGYEVN